VGIFLFEVGTRVPNLGWNSDVFGVFIEFGSP